MSVRGDLTTEIYGIGNSAVVIVKNKYVRKPTIFPLFGKMVRQAH